MREKRKILTTAVITILLVFVIAFSISGTVLSQSRENARALEQYYRVAEIEYVHAVRDFLNEKGYKNSGITMNSVTEADGTRSYVVTIHHGKIDALDDARREELVGECRKIRFRDADCAVSYTFLVLS